jgi:hypothetical protein
MDQPTGVKAGELVPGDLVQFHHHRRGKMTGTYVGRHGKRHHHVVADERHLAVHQDALVATKKAAHHVRNRRLRGHLSNYELGPEEHEHDIPFEQGHANLRHALGMDPEASRT